MLSPHIFQAIGAVRAYNLSLSKIGYENCVSKGTTNLRFVRERSRIEREKMKLTSKIAATIAAGALACGMLGVVGCSSAEETPTELTTASINAQDIEVTGVGFTVLDDNSINYAFTVNNPNEGYIADGVTFTLEGYDENGSLLVGGGETIQTIYPSVPTAAAGTAYLSPSDSPLTRLEIKPLMEHVNWTKTTETPEEIQNEFTTSDVKIEDVDGLQQVTGKISIDFGNDSSAGDSAASMLDMRETARIVVVFKNEAGDIIGGGSSSSIMLDASMIPIYGAATPELDEAGNPIEPEEGAEGADAQTSGNPEGDQASNVASTTWTITVPGGLSYASYDVMVTPGV